MSNIIPLTQGISHVGLTVSDLEKSAAFFINLLGWIEVKRKVDYPAIFVSDGNLLITLWDAKTTNIQKFDRKENVGLHHLALSVKSFDVLDLIHEKLVANEIQIEFEPELLGEGPAKHMMCYEPSGIRIEFLCKPV